MTTPKPTERTPTVSDAIAAAKTVECVGPAGRVTFPVGRIPAGYKPVATNPGKHPIREG
jgi:hypothetical protein